MMKRGWYFSMLNKFNFNLIGSVNNHKTSTVFYSLTSIILALFILTSSLLFIIPTISAVGDLNNDEKVDFADILIVIKWLFNIDRTNNAADVNGDNEVNIYDIVIVSRLLGKQYGNDTTVPGIISHRPSATILPLGTTSVVVGVEVNEKAVCRYSNVAGGNFSINMTLFERTGGIFNSYNATGLQNNQSYNYYVKCMDEAGNLNSTDYYFNFSVGLPAEGDTTAPVRSAGSPSGTLAAGTTQTTLSLTTNEAATCRYSNVSGTAYASITNTFSTTGSTSHSQLITGLTNGSSYNYYVRCNDSSGNVNTDDYAISFSVATNASVTIEGGLTSGEGEPLFNPSNSNHVSLFYDDFSSYVVGDPGSLFDGSGDNTWEVSPAAGADTNPDYTARKILNDTGGCVVTSYGTSCGQQSPVFGDKYLRLDYTPQGPQRVRTQISRGMGTIASSDTYDTLIITMYLRNVGTVFHSKYWEWFSTRGTSRWVMEEQRQAEFVDARAVFWKLDSDTGSPYTEPIGSWCNGVIPGGGYGLMISNRAPPGQRGLNNNMGGPSFDVNSIKGCGQVSHPIELRNDGTAYAASSGEWWRYTIKITREVAGEGTGKMEMWVAGTNPNNEGRRTAGVKIFDWDGTSNGNAPGLVFTEPLAVHMMDFIYLGGTTSGNNYNEDSPYNNGAYLDWDAMRIWTEDG
jgi:hypothetical protein